MVIRLVKATRIGAGVRQPGELWDLPVEEAMSLIEDGHAVPVTDDEFAKETR